MPYHKRCPKWKKEKAKSLRKNMTEAEVILWQAIRRKQLGFKFRRQSLIA